MIWCRDIFRVFDSLNYIDNLMFGIDAVRTFSTNYCYLCFCTAVTATLAPLLSIPAAEPASSSCRSNHLGLFTHIA